MNHFINVWFKPWIELSAIDQATMAVEVVAAFFLFALFKVYVIDEFRSRPIREKGDGKR